jgi:predicted Rossmann fold nucleotide-binding protein DprA/Smf involved in DNA uptake
LAAAGWPVVSGLAEGIDGAAHEGCLAAGGAPVGVLGTPLDRTYPRHHRALQQQVAHQGLLVSEWPVGAPVRPGHFASRNRLQVGLARALVVVECPLASGALHSADLAWAQGLPLWVVPADAARLSALGSNRLLARGATPLLTPSDLIDQLGPGPLAGRPWPPAVMAFGDMAVGDRAVGGRTVGPAAAVAVAPGVAAFAATAVGEPPQALTAAAGLAWGAKPAAAMAFGESALAAGAAGEMAAAGLVVGARAAGRRGAGPLGPSALGAGATVQAEPPGGRRLLAAVGAGASLEQISQALELPAEQLAPMLLELELAGLLRAEPGLRWRPAAALEQQGFASERGGPSSVRAK